MGDAEDVAEQADGVLHGQDDTEALEGELEDIHSTEVCGCGREGGIMGPLGNGLVDGGKGPLQANLDV